LIISGGALARGFKVGDHPSDIASRRSTILTSQLPVSRWHENIGDPTLADGILDRLVHNAHGIEMRGDSMRKNRGKPST
jgi:DNA replication protein DnaC